MKKMITTVCAVAVLAMAVNAMAQSKPVPGNPAWDVKYKAANEVDPSLGPDMSLPNNPRTDASGDKIPSNAHSADFPGLYFYWDDKQKENGVLLVNPGVFELFVGGQFILTAKNSNNYWGYEISPATGTLIDGVYAYGINKQIKYNEVGNNGKVSAKTDDLKNINMVFIDGVYKNAKFEIVKNWFDEDGDDIVDEDEIAELNKLLTFNNGYKLGENIVKITDFISAAKGKTITVTETAPGYFEQDGKESQTITVKWDDDPTLVVTFNNQANPSPIGYVTPIYSFADNEVTYIPSYATDNNGGLWDIIWSFLDFQALTSDGEQVNIYSKRQVSIEDAFPIWNSVDTASSGEIVEFTLSIFVPGDKIIDVTPFQIAADNGFALYINDHFVAQSTNLYQDEDKWTGEKLYYYPTDWGFDDNGDVAPYSWETLYTIAPDNFIDFLNVGNNTITVYAYNATIYDREGNSGNRIASGNPACVIFACTVYSADE